MYIIVKKCTFDIEKYRYQEIGIIIVLRDKQKNVYKKVLTVWHKTKNKKPRTHLGYIK